MNRAPLHIQAMLFHAAESERRGLMPSQSRLVHWTIYIYHLDRQKFVKASLPCCERQVATTHFIRFCLTGGFERREAN